MKTVLLPLSLSFLRLGTAWDAQSTRYADAECTQPLGTEVNWTKANGARNCFHVDGWVFKNLQLECNSSEMGQMVVSVYEGENCSGNVLETMPFLMGLDTQGFLEYFTGRCTWIPDGEFYGLMAQAAGIDLLGCFTACLPMSLKECTTDAQPGGTPLFRFFGRGSL